MHKANIFQPQANIQVNVDLINIESVANLLILRQVKELPQLMLPVMTTRQLRELGYPVSLLTK